MLRKTDFFIGETPADKVNYFMTTPYYIALIIALTAISNLFGAELIVYTLFALTAAFVCILGKDLLPLIPMIACGYLTPSVKNNPGKNPDSIFSSAGGGIWVGILAAIIAGALIYWVVRNRKNIFHTKYPLLPGMLLLSATYLLGGIGSNGYFDHALQSMFFAALNGLVLFVPYILLTSGIDWKNARKDYLAWTGFGIGCLLLCEIAWIYLTSGVISNGTIDRTRIYTGWGMYNNIGSYLAMMIPFPFYLATRYHNGWIGTLAGSLFMLGVVLTCSRASILCGGGIWFLCVVLMLYFAYNRHTSVYIVAYFVGGILVLVMLFGEQLLQLFKPLLSQGLDPSNRDDIYVKGLKLFLKYPLFGGSFFSTEYTPWGWSTNAAFSGLIPPRWHNTYVQLLASCGFFGLAAYTQHRLQTVKIFAHSRNPEKIFIACSLVVLLATSLFDCHFFNLGPVMFYSMALAFAENIKEK